MASLHASLRGQVLSGAGDLGTKMANVNRLLYDASDSNRYATFFYAELDCDSRTLHYVNGRTQSSCGAAQRRRRLASVSLGDGGPVVRAAQPARPTSSRCFTLLPGDILLAFTDGIKRMEEFTNKPL